MSHPGRDPGRPSDNPHSLLQPFPLASPHNSFSPHSGAGSLAPWLFWASGTWHWWPEGLRFESLTLPVFPAPSPTAPWGLQDADLEWTAVKQSFLTEVEQLSR